MSTVQQMVQRVVQTVKSEQIGYIDKLPRDYQNKVAYLEEPYFFNDWYGFFYYSN